MVSILTSQYLYMQSVSCHACTHNYYSLTMHCNTPNHRYREDPAIAFTNRPLTVYEHFEVEIISTRLSSGQWHGVLAIGVVTHR